MANVEITSEGDGFDFSEWEKVLGKEAPATRTSLRVRVVYEIEVRMPHSHTYESDEAFARAQALHEVFDVDGANPVSVEVVEYLPKEGTSE